MSEKIKLKRFSKKEVIAFARKTPATSEFAFGERSGGYVIGPSNNSPPKKNVTAK